MIKFKPIEHDVRQFFPDLRKKLEGEESVCFAYLFGSYGRGKPGPLSDVDVAVFLEGCKDYWDKKLELIGEITRTLRTEEVDLVILNQAPLSLRFHVIKTGELLFSKDEFKRIEFEAKTFKFYCDTLPLRELAWKSLTNRIEEGRFGY